jgi:hypothetical protein
VLVIVQSWRIHKSNHKSEELDHIPDETKLHDTQCMFDEVTFLRKNDPGGLLARVVESKASKAETVRVGLIHVTKNDQHRFLDCMKSAAVTSSEEVDVKNVPHYSADDPAVTRSSEEIIHDMPQKLLARSPHKIGEAIREFVQTLPKCPFCYMQPGCTNDVLSKHEIRRKLTAGLAVCFLGVFNDRRLPSSVWTLDAFLDCLDNLVVLCISYRLQVCICWCPDAFTAC